MKKYFIGRLLLLSLSAVIAYGCASANANLVINPVFQSSITSDSNAATIESTINAAISNVEGDIANSVTVIIDFGEVNSGLGQSSTYQYDISYTGYLSLLENNQSLSANDTTALN